MCDYLGLGRIRVASIRALGWAHFLDFSFVDEGG
jgi:hypothetical protein